MKVLAVVGARPNFMKLAPVAKALEGTRIEVQIVHTGQHYDHSMSQSFFEELSLPVPEINLDVGSGSHAEQTAAIMVRFAKALHSLGPDRVLVIGDVNSTIACSLVAAKLGIPLDHLESGLRSFDRSMPEEINRVVTDVLSDCLLTTGHEADVNLRNEGIPAQRIIPVGNTMVDTLITMLPRARKRNLPESLGFQPGTYAAMTLHRPSNVDARDVLENLLGAIEGIQARLPLVFPIHPRTRRNLQDFGLYGRLYSMPNVRLLDPLSYLDFLCLYSQSRLVLSDSGGIQAETSYLHIPCLTLRDTTEFGVTTTLGSNILVGNHTGTILEAAHRILDGQGKTSGDIPLWDGKSAERVRDHYLRLG